jgi:hypothetical protein
MRALKRRQIQLRKTKEHKAPRRSSARIIALKKKNDDDIPLPIQNFEAFQDNIKRILPQVEINPRITERTWKGQCGIWKNALNDRIWAQTVKTEGARRDVKAAGKSDTYTERRGAVEDRILADKKDAGANRRARNALVERERAVLRMSERQKNAARDAENAIMRQRLDNERV